MNVNLFLVLQVIPFPSMLAQPEKAKEIKHDVFAFISVENLKETEDLNMQLKRKSGKILRGKIMKCNLTESRMASGLILGQV